MSVFGRLFRVSTFGESHGASVGVMVEGVPPNAPLTAADIQPQLDRRRPGQSALATQRSETDAVTLLSGVEGGLTLGTPIAAVVQNADTRPQDYAFQQKGQETFTSAPRQLSESSSFIPRPSHADLTYLVKYGLHASSGGGRSSARETVARVIAGAIAEQTVLGRYGIEIVAWVSGVGDIECNLASPQYGDWMQRITRAEVDRHPVRCPDLAVAASMQELIQEVRAAGDSIGGSITCVCRGVPAGLGEPCFDKLEAELARAMMSIPATKGFEVGMGFQAARMRGSQHNDPFVQREGARLGTATNHGGGTLGGISSGESIVFRVAFKPPATIGCAQQTCTLGGQSVELAAKGRHDPCVVNRAVPIVEGMAAMVLADMLLLQLSRTAAAVALSPLPVPMQMQASNAHQHVE